MSFAQSLRRRPWPTSATSSVTEGLLDRHKGFLAPVPESNITNACKYRFCFRMISQSGHMEPPLSTSPPFNYH